MFYKTKFYLRIWNDFNLFLFDYDLLDMMDGTKPCPPATITTNNAPAGRSESRFHSLETSGSALTPSDSCLFTWHCDAASCCNYTCVSPNRSPFQPPHSRGHSNNNRGPPQSKNPNHRSNQPPLACQFCDKRGHVARFTVRSNRNFKVPTLPSG